MGTLARTPLVPIFALAAERGMCGTVEVLGPDGGHLVVGLTEGRIEKVKSSGHVPHLGRVLLEAGIITQEQHDASLMRFAKEGGLHGHALVKMGAVTAAKLVDGLRVQAGLKLDHAAATLPKESVVSFYDGADLLAGFGGTERLAIDPFSILWRLTGAAATMDHAVATTNRFGERAVRIRPGAAVTRLGLPANVAQATELLRARAMTVADLASMGVVDERAARLLLYTLFVCKLAEVVDAVTVDGAVTSLPRASPSTPATHPPSGGPASRSSAGSPPVGRSASVIPPAPPTPHISGMPARTAAPEVVRPVIPASKSAPPAGGRSPSTPPASDRGAAPPDSDRRRVDLLEAHAALDRMDHFAVLGVERDATVDAIKRAFLDRAKRWHPDRAPSSQADLKPICEKLFSRLMEANDVLLDPARRRVYVDKLTRAAAAPPRPDGRETTALLARAEQCAGRRNFADAERIARQVLAADGKHGGARAVLAWIESQKDNGGHRSTLEASVQKLDEIVAKDMGCERAFYYRALLHRALGRQHLATRDFRRAVELNPENVDALRELRLAERRRESVIPPARGPAAAPPEGEDGRTGLLGSFFKKK